MNEIVNSVHFLKQQKMGGFKSQHIWWYSLFSIISANAGKNTSYSQK